MDEYVWVPIPGRNPEWVLMCSGSSVASVTTWLLPNFNSRRQEVRWKLRARNCTRSGTTTKNLKRELNRLFAGEPIPPCPWGIRFQYRIRTVVGSLTKPDVNRLGSYRNKIWAHSYASSLVEAPVGFRLVEELP